MPCVDFEFDADAVADAYAADAERYAQTYGDHVETNDFDRSVLAHLLAQVPEGGLVLDLGCGPAQVAAFAEARGFRAVGLDLTYEMLEQARHRVRAPLVQGDMRALPFAPRSFDCVVAWYSLLHLPTSSVAGALADIRRLLRRGGLLVVALHGKKFGEASVGWNAYTASELASVLRANGFVDVVSRTRPPGQDENPVPKVIASGVR